MDYSIKHNKTIKIGLHFQSFYFSASISQEKAQNENKFISERRKFKKEKEELVAQVNQLRSSEESLR